MDSNKYIDSFNGVWTTQDNRVNSDFSWYLLSGNSTHTSKGLYLGKFHIQKEVEQVGPLIDIGTGQQYEFPVRFPPGESVKVDALWVGNHITSSPSYDQADDTIVGTSLGPGERSTTIIVTISVEVPVRKVMRYAS